MVYAALAAKMDARVDDRLGDPLVYAARGMLPFVPLKGFVIDPAENAGETLDFAIDELGKRTRLKVNRLLIPNPSRDDRLMEDPAFPGSVPLLQGRMWRLEAKRPIVAGRYWIIDLTPLQG